MPQNHSMSKDYKSLVFAFVSMCLLTWLLSLIFEFRWRTNDDVLMAMISHGYGLIFESSPNLVFSNVLWGHFIKALPSSDWLPGYSFASYLCLLISGSVFIHALNINNYSKLSIGVVILFFMLGPIVSPQFTINAGLLMAASITSLLIFKHMQYSFYLYLSMALAFIAFLVRKEEMLLVLLVAIPIILPIKNIFSGKKVFISIIVTLLAITGAYYLDKESYKSPDWQHHQAFESVRNYFTDIKVQTNYVVTQENLQNHNLSHNDVLLLQNWFFVDPNIANVENLRSFTSQIKEKKSNQEMSNVMESLLSFFDIKVIGLTLLIVLFVAKTKSRKLLCSLLMSIAAFAFIGWMGRPGIIRIYIPVLTLLAAVPLISFPSLKILIRQSHIQLCLIAFILFNFLTYYHMPDEVEKISEVRKSFAAYHGESFYVWGGEFPYELLYPVFDQDNKLKRVKLLGMNTSTFSPYSNTSKALSDKTNFSELLLEEGGVVMYSLPNNRINMLNQYCKEHVDGAHLNTTPYINNRLQFNQYKCTRYNYD